VNKRKAFLVIVTYPDSAHEPHIGDISWTLKRDMDRSGWDAHTTEATAEMLAHHGVPYPTPENVECPTCHDTGLVDNGEPADSDTIFDICTHCIPENVEER
jgi:hypothetical protein